MGKAPNPIELTQPFHKWIEEMEGVTEDLNFSVALVERHRYLDCLNYNACLKAVVEAKWKNFSCLECDEMPILQIRIRRP